MRVLRYIAGCGRFAAVLCAGLPLPGGATPDAMDWNVVGGWDISYYPTSKGCQAFALFEGDTAFFIGFDDSDAHLSLNVTLIDQSWTQIEDGTEYPIRVRFGSNPAWTLDMDGRVIDGYPALSIHIDAHGREARQFIREFQLETEMEWSFDDTDLARMTLRGSLKAFEAVNACQQADHSLSDVPDDVLDRAQPETPPRPAPN